MRYFIHDLHYQLDQLQTSFIESLKGKTNLILYRGRPMKINQLIEMRESISGILIIKNFLSATQNERFAIEFSGDGKTKNPDEVSVIYEILIDTNIRSLPFAKIKDIIKGEEEILFSMGSIFRIGKIVEHRQRVYYIQLIMEHIDKQLWNKLTPPFLSS